MWSRCFYSFRWPQMQSGFFTYCQRLKTVTHTQNIINSAMILQKILQIGVISYNMTLFKIMCVLHQISSLDTSYYENWPGPIPTSRVCFNRTRTQSVEQTNHVKWFYHSMAISLFSTPVKYIQYGQYTQPSPIPSYGCVPWKLENTTPYGANNVITRWCSSGEKGEGHKFFPKKVNKKKKLSQLHKARLGIIDWSCSVVACIDNTHQESYGG